MFRNGTFIVMEEDVIVTQEEQQFNGNVRENIITLILSILLGIIAHVVLSYYRRRKETEDLYGSDREDELVYRISFGLCVFSLATSFAAMLLLPFSVAGNEIKVLYPDNYLIEWLTSSLVHGLWNKVFLCSNVSLLIFLPFTYLFMESSGFSGSRRGMMARFKETAVMMFLLTILSNCVAWVLSAVFDVGRRYEYHNYETWNFYLPEVYSWISIFGVSVLLFFTPVGFAILFTEVGKYLMKPQFLRDINEELYSAKFEEESLQRKLRVHLPPDGRLMNGALAIHKKLEEAQRDREKLERRRQASSIVRNLSYPLVMVVLSGLTFLAIVMVGLNILELLFDRKALPVENHNVVLGKTSLSTFGIWGAIMEIAIIVYILVASIAGLYSYVPSLRPKKKDTDLTKVLANCAVFLILSSALPVLCRILGISNFDLLGAFGRQPWLANLYLIITYNVLFGLAATSCLVMKFSAPVRQAMYNKVKQAFTLTEKRSHSLSDFKYFD